MKLANMLELIFRSAVLAALLSPLLLVIFNPGPAARMWAQGRMRRVLALGMLFLSAVIAPLAMEVLFFIGPIWADGSKVLGYGFFVFAGSALFAAILSRFRRKAGETDSGLQALNKACRSNAYLVLIPAIILAVFLPKTAMLFCLSSDSRNLGRLYSLRTAIGKFQSVNGRYPSELSELGIEVPELSIWAWDEIRDDHHRHRASGDVLLMPGLGKRELMATFCADAYVRKKRIVNGVLRTVSVPVGKASLVGDFNDYDPAAHPMKRNQTRMEITVPLKPGTYEYGFIMDGNETPRRQADTRERLVTENVFTTRAPVDDAGKWIYDPETGRIIIGCTGRTKKNGTPWYQY
ncbi:MAG: hypothetical protein ABIG11_06795 [bacterium]